MTEIDSSLPLTNEGRASGFSIVADDCRNTTLLKRGKQVAWFSAMVNEETLSAFVKLIKSLTPDREERNGR